jgi:hypothetical protein
MPIWDFPTLSELEKARAYRPFCDYLTGALDEQTSRSPCERTQTSRMVQWVMVVALVTKGGSGIHLSPSST